LLATYTEAGTTLRVYRRTAGSFNEVWSASVPDVGASDEVGLAISGERLAVGASLAAVDGAVGAGEVRLLLRQPDDTYAPDTVLRTTAVADLQLGRTIAMDANRVLASSGGSTGRVYDFEL
jgi:hypothetical protein